MTLEYNINCTFKSLVWNTTSNIIGRWLVPARDDWWLSSMSKADPGQCVPGLRSIRVWFSPSLHSLSGCEFLLRACPVFALRPPSVHTEWGRRAFWVHWAFTLRSPCVNAAFTLRSLWFIRKWATLNAACTLSADWVHACWNHSSACVLYIRHFHIIIHKMYIMLWCMNIIR